MPAALPALDSLRLRIAARLLAEAERYLDASAREPRLALRNVYGRMASAKQTLAAALAPAGQSPPMLDPGDAPLHPGGDDGLLRLIEAVPGLAGLPDVRAALKRYVPQIEACRADWRRLSGEAATRHDGDSGSSGTLRFG